MAQITHLYGKKNFAEKFIFYLVGPIPSLGGQNFPAKTQRPPSEPQKDGDTPKIGHVPIIMFYGVI